MNRSKKEKAKSGIRIYPDLPKRGPLPRTAIVDYGNEKKLLYRLDFISDRELDFFWYGSDQLKLKFLSEHFNRHHRLPRVQGGPNCIENLSFVDVKSHQAYNHLIELTARVLGIDVKEVKTNNIASFLNRMYPIFDQLFIRKDVELRNLNRLRRADRNRLKSLTAVWARKQHKRLIENGQMNSFLKKAYLVFNRLAVNQETGELLSFHDFVDILNDIWFPLDDQAFFGASAVKCSQCHR